MKCPKCGFSLPEDSEFCQYCGTKIDVNVIEDVVVENTANLEQQENIPVAILSDDMALTSTDEEIEEDAGAEKNEENDSLLIKAYKSFASNVPEERAFFEQMRGSPELKTAYLEECEKNQRDYNNGIRVNYKQSYTIFMGVLHNDYFAKPVQNELRDEMPRDQQNNIISVIPDSKEQMIKQNYCKKCGSQIDSATKKCTGCGKQYFRAKTTVPILLLAVFLALSLGLNVTQYLFSKDSLAAIENLETTVNSQGTEITQLNNKISSQSGTITSLRNQIDGLEEKANNFDIICSELSSGNIGYAANNFKASESVIVVNKNTTGRKFTLTANWSSGGTVSVDYSSWAAWVDFDNNSWTTSTTMTINPNRAGVTAVTFSNNIDSKTFKIIIIVTD